MEKLPDRKNILVLVDNAISGGPRWRYCLHIDSSRRFIVEATYSIGSYKTVVGQRPLTEFVSLAYVRARSDWIVKVIAAFDNIFELEW